VRVFSYRKFLYKSIKIQGIMKFPKKKKLLPFQNPLSVGLDLDACTSSCMNKSPKKKNFYPFKTHCLSDLTWTLARQVA
jgi:hypothetical protein